eukprot:gene6343-10350_t
MRLQKEFEGFYEIYGETEDPVEKLRLTREVYNPLLNRKKFLDNFK